MTETITRFNHDIAATLEARRRIGEIAQLDFMNSIMEHVVDFGGYCDASTFSAAFYGGVDTTCTSGDATPYDTQAAFTTPEEFKKARAIAERIRSSTFEPFVTRYADTARNSRQGIGIIMPGSSAFAECNVGYKIMSQGSQFIGRAIFNGLTKAGGDQHQDHHSLLVVERPHSRIAPSRLWVKDAALLGVEAAQEHLLARGDPTRHNTRGHADTYLEKLQAKARKYYESHRKAQLKAA